MVKPIAALHRPSSLPSHLSLWLPSLRPRRHGGLRVLRCRRSWTFVLCRVQARGCAVSMYDRGVEMVIADFGWWEGSRPGIIDKLTQLRGLLSEVRHRKREIMENTNISKTVAFHMIGPIGRWGQQQFVVESRDMERLDE
jgi:hypothetical protein